ncbi:hypothetical protein SBOR_4763 [Sclerotinia borealis F-4128]|uniref:Apple domain-containing protein n=1 Tax=Sclerotinia borealis (strain F-4128) TaxID=1432307 RepID=W9CDR5_SCLBF|nr:hypothetical protein SBOR_4763 [Sclerotinia borealis F-4128]
MYLQHLLFALTSLSVTNLVNSSPTYAGTLSTPPPPGETYVVGYPICATPGFTEVPGDYTETTHQYPGATLTSCINECRAAYPACKSIAFHARYTECLWFDKKVDKTQLYKDDTIRTIGYSDTDVLGVE